MQHPKIDNSERRASESTSLSNFTAFAVKIAISGCLFFSGCVGSTSPDASGDDVIALLHAHVGPGAAPMDPNLVPSWLRPFATSLVDEMVFSLGKYDASAPKAEDIPHFHFLPDEEPHSVSFGDTSNGRIYGAREIAGHADTWRVLPRQRARDLRYGSDELIALLEDAAGKVAAQFSPAVMLVGNVGRPHGGDIPYSVSHNSGRDADIAFYALNPDGESVEMPDMLSFDDLGRSIEYAGYYTFDIPRNWALVAALIESDAAALQYLFVSNGLRSLMLGYARQIGARAETIRRAEILLRQPGVDNPHNDHLHVRVFCSASDIQAGCRDTGAIHAWAPARSVSPQQGVERALRFLKDERPDARIAALRRIEVLRQRDAYPSIIPLIMDQAEPVRATALEVALRLNGASALDTVVAQIEHENSPELLLRLLSIVVEEAPERAFEVLAPLVRLDERDVRAAWLVGEDKAEALVYHALDMARGVQDFRMVPELLSALGDPDPIVRMKAADAISFITNHRPTPVDALAGHDWDEINGLRLTWERELTSLLMLDAPDHQKVMQGFAAAGLDITKGPREVAQSLAVMCGDERPWLSVNAQRILFKMTGNRADSLSWDRADAQEYWVRWTERNRTRISALR